MDTRARLTGGPAGYEVPETAEDIGSGPETTLEGARPPSKSATDRVHCRLRQALDTKQALRDVREDRVRPRAEDVRDELAEMLTLADHTMNDTGDEVRTNRPHPGCGRLDPEEILHGILKRHHDMRVDPATDVGHS